MEEKPDFEEVQRLLNIDPNIDPNVLPQVNTLNVRTNEGLLTIGVRIEPNPKAKALTLDNPHRYTFFNQQDALAAAGVSEEEASHSNEAAEMAAEVGYTEERLFGLFVDTQQAIVEFCI